MENNSPAGNYRFGAKTAMRQHWKLYGLIFAAYTLYASLKIPEIYFRNMHSVYQLPWGEPIGLLALWSYLWAFLTPFIISLARRFSIARKFFLRNLLLQIGFGIVFAGIHRAATIFILLAFAPSSINVPEEMTARAFYFLHFVSDGFFDYVQILVIIQAIIYFREVQEREFRLQQAELQTLKTQLQPHFLFNTLNAISSLVASSPKAAQTTIAQLSDLLRLSLKDNRAQEVTLKDELDFTRKYVQIQQTLLQERLKVEWNIEPEALDALVPSLILQPLVENSIRHGISPKESGGSIQINIARENNTLALILIDDGLGFSSNENPESSVGLTNTRTRLQYLYGDAHEFDLSETEKGGVTANIRIPFRVNKEENRL